MNRTDKNNRSLRNSRKITLQNRMFGEKRRNAFSELVKQEVHFLDLETSVAIWDVLITSHKLVPSPYNSYFQFDVEDNFESYVRKVETVLADFGKSNGFCFTYYWRSTGVAMLDAMDLCNNLNAILFSHNDEISFFNANLNKAILLLGDRIGSGDKLNELSISILGEAWVKKWKEGTK